MEVDDGETKGLRCQMMLMSFLSRRGFEDILRS